MARPARRATRWGRWAAIGVVVGTMGVVATARPVAAQESSPTSVAVPATVDSPSTLPLLPEGAGSPIQRPDSGHAPTDSGDRGGSQQVVLFWLLLVGLAAIGLFAWRDTRRGRAKRRQSVH